MSNDLGPLPSVSADLGPYDNQDVASGVSVTPSVATVVFTAQNPTVVLGDLSVVPSVATAIFTGVNPTIVAGSVSVTPSIATVVFGGANPTVQYGSVSVTPSIATVIFTAVDPSVFAGAALITPAIATVVYTAVAPTVVLGSVIVIPAVATVSFLASSPLSSGATYVGIEDGKFFDGGEDRQVSIPVSGSYSTGTPVRLEYQLVNNSVDGSWIRADDAVIAGGTYTFVAERIGNSLYWYTLNVRTLAANGSVLETFYGTDEFCVGKLAVIHGQSNGAYFATEGTKSRTYASSTITWNGSSLTYSKGTTGQGAVALAQTLADYFDCAIGVYVGAIAGCALLEENSYIEDIPSYTYVSFPFWLGPDANAQVGSARSSRWPNFLAGLQAIEADPSWIIFIGGEADCLQHSPINTPTNTYGRPVSRLEFKAGLVQLKSLFVGAGYLAPMYVSPLGQYHFDDTVLTEWEESHSEVRDIQSSTELAFMEIYPCPSHYDLPRVDLAHMSGANYEVLANRIANTIILDSPRSLGPIIKRATEIDKARKQILVNVEHVTGSSLAFGSDNAPRDDLFVIKEDGTPVTISSIQLQDSAFLITLNSALTGSIIELAYIRGTGFDSTETGALVDKWASVAGTGGAIFDDAGYPMQPQSRFITVESYRGF